MFHGCLLRLIMRYTVPMSRIAPTAAMMSGDEREGDDPAGVPAAAGVSGTVEVTAAATPSYRRCRRDRQQAEDREATG